MDCNNYSVKANPVRKLSTLIIQIINFRLSGIPAAAKIIESFHHSILSSIEERESSRL